MSKIILSIVALLHIGFTIYLFFTGNIALAIILLITGLVLIPLVKMFGKHGIHVTAAPDQNLYGETHKGSGSSGM